MNDETLSILTAAIWRAMDDLDGDRDAVSDAVQQALDTWEPA